MIETEENGVVTETLCNNKEGRSDRELYMIKLGQDSLERIRTERINSLRGHICE